MRYEVNAFFMKIIILSFSARKIYKIKVETKKFPVMNFCGWALAGNLHVERHKLGQNKNSPAKIERFQKTEKNALLLVKIWLDSKGMIFLEWFFLSIRSHLSSKSVSWSAQRAEDPNVLR